MEISIKIILAALSLAAIVVTSTLAQTGQAAGAVNSNAARSVHLRYIAPDSTVFYNEIKVERSVPGSYFMACGFARGYFGIQEKGDGEKVALFSVWDPTAGDDPVAVEKHDQVEVLGQGDGVTVKRFGGEGTGGQSFFGFNWKIGETYKLVVVSRIEGEKTTYAGYVFDPAKKAWRTMAIFRTKSSGTPLRGLYSFIEDFRRGGGSVNQIRRASFSNGWVKTTEGAWMPLTKARFTADDNTQMHINAGIVGDGFFLQNGGATVNQTPLLTIMERGAVPDLSGLPALPAP